MTQRNEFVRVRVIKVTLPGQETAIVMERTTSRRDKLSPSPFTWGMTREQIGKLVDGIVREQSVA